MRQTGVLILAIILTGGLLFGQGNEKFSSEFQNIDQHGNVDVIVQYNEVPTAEHHQKVLDRGGKLRHTLELVKGGAYTMPAWAIADLASDPSVVHISVDHKLGAKLDYTTAATNASAAWASGWDGTGVGVAIVDSGITDSQDFSNKTAGPHRIVYSQNFNGTGAANG